MSRRWSHAELCTPDCHARDRRDYEVTLHAFLSERRDAHRDGRLAEFDARPLDACLREAVALLRAHLPVPLRASTTESGVAENLEVGQPGTEFQFVSGVALLLRLWVLCSLAGHQRCAADI